MPVEDIKELVHEACNGNNTAFDKLEEKYSPLINSLAEKYYSFIVDDQQRSKDLNADTTLTREIHFEKDEFRQEAAIAFYDAIKTFDTEQEKVTFGLYAKVCIKNRLVSLLRKIRAKTKKDNKVNRTKLSGSGESFTVARSSSDPEKKLIQREKLTVLAEAADGVLSKYEKRIFDIYKQGASYREIAGLVGKSEKSVDNAIYRIKVKLKNIYK